MSNWEVRKRTRYGLCCTECGVAFMSSWKYRPEEAEQYRGRAERYGCKNCENRRKVAALPPHHAHHEHNPDWPYPSSNAPCCAAAQLHAISPFDCEECGEHFPCPAVTERRDAQ